MNKQFEPVPFEIDGLFFSRISHHRNGVWGTPFYCAVATDVENKRDVLITYFPNVKGECCCAVYQLDLLPDITFGINSFRGDLYAPSMIKAIAEYNKQHDAWMNA